VKGIPRGRYTKEFQEEAVKLVTEEHLSIPEAARRLELAPTTVDNWVRASKSGKLRDIGKGYRQLTEVEIELVRIKKQNATLKMENEILKRAAAYFARESLQGTR
jgi:transposase-like protein